MPTEDELDRVAMDKPPIRNTRGADKRQCVLVDRRTVREENTVEVQVQEDVDWEENLVVGVEAVAAATATEVEAASSATDTAADTVAVSADAASVTVACSVNGPLERAVALVCRFRQWHAKAEVAEAAGADDVDSENEVSVDEAVDVDGCGWFRVGLCEYT